MKSSASRLPPDLSLDQPPLAGIPVAEWQALSAFRRAVYTVLCGVPAGRVTTYGALARALGCRSPRAVGQALRHNPFAPSVPCHRVVASDLSLGGYAGHTGGPDLERKRRLLHAEGVRTSAAGQVADPGRIAILRKGKG